MPGSDVTVNAAFGDAVMYMKLDGSPEWCSAYTPVAANGKDQTWTSGWYVVDGSVSFGQDYFVISGDVNLILCDSCDLSTTAYIGVTAGNSLTVWGQGEGTGKLRSETSGYSFVAAIGGNQNAGCGTVVINGGQITAKGSQGAGIGGGWGLNNTGTGGGSITINRGTVSASSGNGSAAIGGGNSAPCGAIVINGGTVTASQSIRDASAIGGRGGSVTAEFAGGYSGNKTGMIGGSGVTVAINGGRVTGCETGGIEGSAVTLSYTDETKNSIRIFSPLYTGTVTLEKGFMNDGSQEFFPAGEYAGGDLAGKTLVPMVFDWNTMQGMLYAGTAEITLPYDITVASSDAALTVPAGKTVTVDLNGHTMDGRSVKTDNNEACVISALDSTSRLILRNGTVLGGGAEGGIYSYFDAHITLDGVNVTGSTGHGVELNDGAILTFLEGTTISGNSGCGVYTDSSCTVEVSGKPVIRDNEQGGVYLYTGVKITVTGELDETAQIGVTAQETPTASNPVLITSGLSGKGTAKNFFSDSAAYTVGLNADGEAVLGLPATITFEAGYETEETMDPVTILAGCAYPLPAPEFSTPYNMIFSGWMNRETGVIVPAEEEITMSEDTTLIAVWNYEWVVLQELINATEDGGTLTLTRSYAALPADTNLLVSAGRTLTIDLNGNVVDGMRLNTDTVLMVNGTLTLCDSAEKGGGVILGQNYHSGIDLPSGGKLTLTGGTISCSGTTQSVYIHSGSFVMNGGMVTAGPNGSAYGVTVTGDGVFDLNRGIIFARQTTDGCAINICSDGYVSLQGQPVIMDHIKTGRPMTISGPISQSINTIVVKPGEEQTSERTVTVTDGMYYLAMDVGVLSNLLHEAHSYSVSNGENTYTVTASVLTFARSYVVNGKTDKEGDLGKALYLNNRAAVEAFSS